MPRIFTVEDYSGNTIYPQTCIEAIGDNGRPITFDNAPTSGSTSLLRSGVVFENCMNWIETTYADLVQLRDGGNLTAGAWYRITDYMATTTQEDTNAVNNQFDILVMALENNILSENAYATTHEGDTYYTEAGARLSSWELKYCLDNDASRFTWADSTNGKGVIFYMKDEWDNECSYDFKNIQFKRYKITECEYAPELVGLFSIINTGLTVVTVDENNPYWLYTFSVVDDNVVYDSSVFQNKYIGMDGGYSKTRNNKILQNYSQYIYTPSNERAISLNDNVFATDIDVTTIPFNGYFGNTFGVGCCYNTLGNFCSSNTFGNGCRYNLIGEMNLYNNLSYFCENNLFGSLCGYNVFIDGSSFNIIGYGCNTNKFGFNTIYNTLGSECTYNYIGDNSYYNTLSTNCDKNVIEKNSSHNSFGEYSTSNKLGCDCSHNTFGQVAHSNILENDCSYNVFGEYCGNNTYATSCTYNTMGNYFFNNNFGEGCTHIYFGVNEESGVTSFCQYIKADCGVKNIHITSKGTTSLSLFLQNVHILSGNYLNDVSLKDKYVSVVPGLIYQSNIGFRTDGKSTIYNPSDVTIKQGDITIPGEKELTN